MHNHIRHGHSSVRPYLHGPVSLVDFVLAVFDAKELERHVFSVESFHAELQVGDSVIVIEAGDLPAGIQPWTNSIYVYVPDVDAAFQRAIEHGATAIAHPEQKPYEERQAGFRDEAGNTWWISTYEAGS